MLETHKSKKSSNYRSLKKINRFISVINKKEGASCITTHLLDAAALAEQARLDKEREKNRNVSYRWWELIPMFLFAPFYMSYGMRRLPGIIVLLPVHLLSWTPVDFSDMFRELRRLKEEKYDLKFKQRLTALIAGDLIYFTGVWYYFISPNL